MKKDFYMMSMTKYETRVREIRREKGASLGLVTLGVLIILPMLQILGVGGGNMHSVGWLMLIIGLALVSFGTALFLGLRKERRELEEWKSWELETQATLMGSGGHNSE